MKKKVQLSHGDGNNNNNNNSSKSISKGQWERRLQTDIHKAKQALCEALSGLDDNHKSDTSSTIFSTTPISQTSTYASSAENIARLLEKWVKKSPISSESSSVSSASASCVNKSCSPSDGGMSSAAFLSFNNSSNSDVLSQSDMNSNQEARLSVELETDHDQAIVETEMPLSLLEKWLLDDAAHEGQDGDFMDMALVGTAHLF